MQHNVKIASRATERSRLPIPREANASSILDARWNFCLDGTLVQHPALSFALRTRIRDHAPGALAGGAGTGHGEKSLLVADLPTALARTACYRTLAGGSA